MMSGYGWSRTVGRESGRELFLSDAIAFVDDAEAYEKYNREEPDNDTQKAQDNSSTSGPSTSSVAAVSEGGDSEIDDDDDDLDMDELNELEATFSKSSIQIQEPGT